jgi:sRNA-binding carbon storage regulator CsrA
MCVASKSLWWITDNDIVTRSLKVGIVEPEEISIARQRLSKQISEELVNGAQLAVGL